MTEFTDGSKDLVKDVLRGLPPVVKSDAVIDSNKKKTNAELFKEFQNNYAKPKIDDSFDWLNPKKATPTEAKEQALSVEKYENDLQRLASELYQSGKFIDFCTKQFQKIWISDEHILKVMLYTAASFKLKNPDEGVHVHVTGITQIGKSDSCKTAFKFIPDRYKLIRTFSPKWIFHANQNGTKIQQNCILFSDDTKLDEEVAGLYRNILTSWHEGVIRGTVINNKAVDLEVPKHVSLILTSIDSVCEIGKEGQDESRFVTVEVRRTAELDKEIREFIQKQRVDISKQLSLIHTVWNLIPEQEVTIHKLIDRNCTIREFKRFMTFVKCNALLHNRTTTTDDDFNEVESFLAYSKPMIDAQTPAHQRDEEAILSILTSQWKTIKEIRHDTGMSYLRTIRAIRGNTGTMENPSGGLLNDKLVNIDYNTDTRQYSFSRRFI
jgi:hypothetical protein